MADTIELYYESAYTKEFDAVVTGCNPVFDKEGDFFEITLDRTAFFPEQGGQSSDLGQLLFGDDKRAVVSHTAIDKDKVIKHISDCEIAVGEKVHGIIDWEHRFSNMQQHTGEHIFSGIVNSMFGYDNVGFHLSDQEVTMDYNGVLTAENIREIELKVNKAIWENIEVVCEFPDKEALEQIDYRSKKELTGDIRIVTIGDYDCCACCAPHVLRTGEVGILKVIGLQNYKKGVRVNILCGKRALEYICEENKIVSELSNMLTTSKDNILPAFKKNTDEIIKLKSELSAVREKLIEYEISNISPSLKDVFLVKDAGIDQNVMRKTVNALSEKHDGYCGFFSGDVKNGYRFIIASGRNKKSTKDLLTKLKEKCDVKGGGSDLMVQGSFSCENIDDVVKCLKE